MSADCFLAGEAPICRKDCYYQPNACRIDGIPCTGLDEFNELLGVAWAVAEQIARIRDPERRREVALSTADAFYNAFPQPGCEWFNDRKFVRLCGVSESVKVAS